MGILVGREREELAVKLALVARQHAVLIGPPGTAKSLLVETIAGAAGLRVFKLLMSPFTTDTDLYGPTDVKALTQEGRYRRLVDGFLPTAEVAFLDEIFKASRAILNSLLRIMNERRFMVEAPYEIEVPLVSVLSGANEIPPPELSAIYDRFLIRAPVRYLQRTESNLMSLLKFGLNGVPAFPVRDMWAVFDRVIVPDEILRLIVAIVFELEKEGIVVSDRRIRQSVDVLKASAVLNGRDVVERSDLLALEFVFWHDPKHVEKVRSVIREAVSPELAQVEALMSELEQSYTEAIRNSTPQSIAEFIAKAKNVVEELKKIRTSDPEVARAIDEAVERINGWKMDIVSGGGRE
jgi:MoxR-like ATPase